MTAGYSESQIKRSDLVKMFEKDMTPIMATGRRHNVCVGVWPTNLACPELPAVSLSNRGRVDPVNPV